MADFSRLAQLIKEAEYLRSSGGQKDPWIKAAEGISGAVDTLAKGTKSWQEIMANKEAIEKARLDSSKTAEEVSQLQYQNTPFPTPAIAVPNVGDKVEDLPPINTETPYSKRYEAETDKKGLVWTDAKGNVVPYGTPGASPHTIAPQKAPPQDKRFTPVIGSGLDTRDNVNTELKRAKLPLLKDTEDITYDAWGKLRNANIANTRQSAVNSRFDQNLLSKYQSGVTSNPSWAKSNDQLMAANKLSEMLDLAEQGDQVAFGNARAMSARQASEVGVMTNQDLDRYAQSSQFIRGSLDKLRLLIEGKPTDLTISDMRAVSEALQRKSEEQKDSLRFDQAKMLAQNSNNSLAESFQALGGDADRFPEVEARYTTRRKISPKSSSSSTGDTKKSSKVVVSKPDGSDRREISRIDLKSAKQDGYIEAK